ncbi:MAG: hypothetical protein ACRDRU_07910 [Pseudonocardiaceae bacterium]
MHSFRNALHVALTVLVYCIQIGLCLTGFVFLLIFLGVVLPAVWSTRPDRRQAATDVLTHMLNALRSARPGEPGHQGPPNRADHIGPPAEPARRDVTQHCVRCVRRAPHQRPE